MKNTGKLIFVASLLIGLTVSSCNTSRQVYTNYTYETECLGSGQDGEQILKTWGKGRTRDEAIKQAEKNGVRDVLFNGVRKGNGGCFVKPIITEVNAQERYEEFFNKFFSDKGDYKMFVDRKNNAVDHINVKAGSVKSGYEETYSVVVEVSYTKLKSKMISDGILK